MLIEKCQIHVMHMHDQRLYVNVPKEVANSNVSHKTVDLNVPNNNVSKKPNVLLGCSTWSKKGKKPD